MQRPALAEEEIFRFVSDSCFPSGTAARVGAEVEFLTVPASDPLGYCDLEELREVAAAVALPGRSAVTFEPGAQLEIVSRPHGTLAGTLDALGRDHAALRAALEMRGIRLVGLGLDPVRAERRMLRAPRYDAMEAFFDCDGLSGRTMMCRTAAVQVNLDFGPDPDARWRLAHRIGPVMAAAFTNSALYCAAPSGWRSARLATWAAIDPTRTRAAGGDGTGAWARYALDARLMMIRETPERYVPVLDRRTFADWMRSGAPSIDDFEYHCTTLFPPIRPRGWLEIRMCDALPDPWWQVPIAVWTALLYDPEAGARAADACGDLSWTEAARNGLSDPATAKSSVAVFEAAIDALPRVDARRGTLDVVGEYADRYVARGRTPADDVLDDALPFAVGRTIDLEAAWT